MSAVTMRLECGVADGAAGGPKCRMTSAGGILPEPQRNFGKVHRPLSGPL